MPPPPSQAGTIRSECGTGALQLWSAKYSHHHPLFMGRLEFVCKKSKSPWRSFETHVRFPWIFVALFFHDSIHCHGNASPSSPKAQWSQAQNRKTSVMCHCSNQAYSNLCTAGERRWDRSIGAQIADKGRATAANSPKLPVRKMPLDCQAFFLDFHSVHLPKKGRNVYIHLI